MKKLGSICNCKMPELWIASTKEEAITLKEAGIPFIIWRGSEETLIKLIFLPTLMKKFPKIDWYKLFGITEENQNVMVTVPNEVCTGNKSSLKIKRYGASIASEKRVFGGGGNHDMNDMDLNDYIGDSLHNVNIEELAKLNLLPKFIGEIEDNIRYNLYQQGYWTEGYNKKLGVPLGNFNAAPEAKNLIILDISGSIPRGIADTMITLVESMREQTMSDLIITSDRSDFYPYGTELPDPYKIRRMYGPGNECKEFVSILENKISGRTYGNVISFGDNDTPDYFARSSRETLDYRNMEGTKIGKVWHYHTKYQKSTGYAEWADKFVGKGGIHYDTSWCRCIMR